MARKRRYQEHPQPIEPRPEPWTITPEWKGEDVFILCGGTSVTKSMIDALRGRHVIVVNCMYWVAQWAPLLFFADGKWWRREWRERQPLLKAFPGEIATIATDVGGRQMHVLKRVWREHGDKIPPTGLALRPDTIAMLRTSAQGAMNIAYHKGAGRIILVGMDNCFGKDGRAHCHDEYPWRHSERVWSSKTGCLSAIVEPLQKANVPVINCSLISELPWWPKVDLFEVLK